MKNWKTTACAAIAVLVAVGPAITDLLQHRQPNWQAVGAALSTALVGYHAADKS